MRYLWFGFSLFACFGVTFCAVFTFYVSLYGIRQVQVTEWLYFVKWLLIQIQPVFFVFWPFSSFVILVISNFGFEDGTLVLSVPGHCLTFTFSCDLAHLFFHRYFTGALYERRNLSSCYSYPKQLLWNRPEPTGFFYNNEWHLLHCQQPNRSDYTQCLRGKHLMISGDSTTRQWYSFLMIHLAANKHQSGGQRKNGIENQNVLFHQWILRSSGYLMHSHLCQGRIGTCINMRLIV